nr:hypothetical protein BaRGS_020145 [Batillaria attramentaria]
MPGMPDMSAMMGKMGGMQEMMAMMAKGMPNMSAMMGKTGGKDMKGGGMEMMDMMDCIIQVSLLKPDSDVSDDDDDSITEGKTRKKWTQVVQQAKLKATPVNYDLVFVLVLHQVAV